MKTYLPLLLFTVFIASVCQAQKPTNTQKDIQQVSQSIKQIGSLFKKKHKQGDTTAATAKNKAIESGTDGTMPPPGDKLFAEPGGGVLVADSHGGTVLINGVIYEWGDRTYGWTGNTDVTKTFFPVQVTTDNDWCSVYTGGYYNLGIKTDGSLWSWGWGNTGELGLGDIYRMARPSRIGRDTTWVTVSAADGHAAGIKKDGSLWIWGNNVDQELGVPPSVNSKVLSPIQMGKDHDWVKVAAGYDYNLALKKDGSLWTWGRNQNGDMGVPTLYDTQQAPIRVGHDNDWVKIFTGTSGNASFGIRANGTLWAWGNNASGQLGIGNVSSSPVPVQVGVERDWITLSTRLNNTVAIRADGSVWHWGFNIKGIQRLNIRGKYVAVAAALNFTLLMRSDGTLWAIGNNSDGGLGYIHNPNFYTNDPVQITEFPAPVITTKPKAVLSTILNDDAVLLFKQSNSRLSVWDKNQVAKALDFKLSHDKKQFVLNDQSADYPFDVHVYGTDMNKDGVEEIFVFYGNSFTSGQTGSSVILLMRDSQGDWHPYLGNEGIAIYVLGTRSKGYPDLAAGIPGFQYPVFGWNGTNYTRVKNITETELANLKPINVTVLSKSLYRGR